jgi:hypothetical protein
MESTMKPTSWRSRIKIHPSADLFPMMSPAELQELGEDIKAHGLLHPIQLLSGAVIDGRNRLDAMELVGLTLEFRKRDNQFESQIWTGHGQRARGRGNVIGHCRHNTPIDIPDPARFVVEQNVLRRHLTTAQKSELIAKLLKADPTKSDRAVAEVVKVSHVTVGAKRKELEAGGQIDHVEKRVGGDGKTYKQPTKTVAAISSIDPTFAEIMNKPLEPGCCTYHDTGGDPQLSCGTCDMSAAEGQVSSIDPMPEQPLPEPRASMVEQYKKLDKDKLAEIAEAELTAGKIQALPNHEPAGSLTDQLAACPEWRMGTPITAEELSLEYHSVIATLLKIHEPLERRLIERWINTHWA